MYFVDKKRMTENHCPLLNVKIEKYHTLLLFYFADIIYNLYNRIDIRLISDLEALYSFGSEFLSKHTPCRPSTDVLN